VELRYTRGPQWGHFGELAHTRFTSGRYTVSASSDRMGYRLEGPAIHPRGKATLPSEAACPGAVQIPDNGQPIVLMPDGPTVGGYPKLAVVVRADLRLLAQCIPERGVRFREVSLQEARVHYPEES
jgi:allophanate hydrolase subunit 2